MTTKTKIELVLPLAGTTKNYAKFEVPFDREVTRTSGRVYMTLPEWEDAGQPQSVTVTLGGKGKGEAA